MHRAFKKIKDTAGFKKRGYRSPLIEPDEIFLDSKNLPEFDTQQFEGQIERPISQKALAGVGIVFVLIVLVFSGRLWSLQVADGKTYKHLAENNSLSSEPVFAPRGTIYDRNHVPLAWNEAKTDDTPWGLRSYIESPGFSHVLGYVSYPAKDKSGNYWQTKTIGKAGVEKQYDASLVGTNGSTIIETDIAGKVQGSMMLNPAVPGADLLLTIDSRLQAELYRDIAAAARDKGFKSAAGLMMDIRTGEIIALTNFPEYDSNVISLGKDRERIREYLTSSRTPLLDRAVSGLFTPGSIVKPYIALEALKEGIINPNKKIESRGSISIPNPYFPDKPSVFRDYNKDNGWVDMREALELSSNIYFYNIGGGYKDQKGMGIYNIGKSWKRFHITEETGIDLPNENTGLIPTPEWKLDTFKEDWRLGDTYNTAIGQYGVQVTPIQMLRAVAGIATRGTLVNPHVSSTVATSVVKVTDLDDSAYTVVQEGMHMGAVHGTTADVTPVPFSLATKSGTAQVGPGGKNVNSWMTGFFPYEHPKYAFVIMLENGPAPAIGTAHRVARQFLGWVGVNAPEYGG